MTKLIILNFIFFIFFINQSYSQFECVPKIGEIFVTYDDSISINLDSTNNSEVLMVKKGLTEFLELKCEKDGLINGFIQVSIKFRSSPKLIDFGINSNVMDLFEELPNLELDFATFYNETKDSIKAKKIYLANLSWLKSNKNNEKYDVNSFSSFYNYWINCDVVESDELQVILKYYNKEAYVPVSLVYLRYEFYGMIINSDDAEIYISALEKCIKKYEEKSCQFNIHNMYLELEQLILLKWKNKEYFEALKILNQYLEYFGPEEYKYPLTYYKLLTVYNDENYFGSSSIGAELISSYKNKLIHNSKESLKNENIIIERNQIDMSLVYSYTIASYINKDELDEALKLSNEVIINENLQTIDYLYMHGAILGLIGKENEACEYLNKAYLEGHEKAREVFLERCK